jgi:hypothetical protein
MTMGMNEGIILTFGFLLFLLLRWSFKRLPQEKWQFLASFPLRKESDGRWLGLNLTYYGAFNAAAYTLSCAVVVVLMSASGVSFPITSALLVAVLIICVPASRLVARLVEGKKHTFSIGGASFLGIVAIPWLVFLAGTLWPAGMGHIAPMAVLAAVSIAYTFGEGIGRLACISFGCCYGKPLQECPLWMRRLPWAKGVRFYGATKKIAYATGLEGVEVVPVQAITCILYCITGLAGLYLFLQGFYPSAFMLCLGVTQAWRFASEFLRADYRGGGRISAYQKMSIVAIVYGLGISVFFGASSPHAAPPDIVEGLSALWSPAPLICLQLIWISTFFFTGRSEVTGSTVTFHVHRSRI